MEIPEHISAQAQSKTACACIAAFFNANL